MTIYLGQGLNKIRTQKAVLEKIYEKKRLESLKTMRPIEAEEAAARAVYDYLKQNN